MASETDPRALKLGQKLIGIMGEIGTVEKEGWNANQKYPFVQEVTIANVLRPLLVKYGVMIHQSVAEWRKSEDGKITSVLYRFQIIDADTGEVWPESFHLVDGWDQGDKGPNKASTTAAKFHALRTFSIGAGTKEDAEADEKTDKATAVEAVRSGPRIARGAQAGVQRGGKSSVATQAQVKEIARLVRELELDIDGFVGVVRKVVESEPAEGQTASQWLSGLTSEQASAIITALSTPVVDESGTNGAETVEIVDQEVISIT